jgi:hypothetical protein
MSVTIIESSMPLTEADLVRAEQRMGRPIPSAYRAFLLAHNGGRPEPYAFQMQGRHGTPSQGGCVDWFLGINTGKYYSDLEDLVKAARSRISPHLFPIGTDPGGNLICLSTSVSDEGAVYFWDHEFEGETPSCGNVYFIASSFEVFLNGLFAYDDE